jgi:acylpyruvate hydrolase
MQKMRLLTYEKNGVFGLAARRNDHLVDLGNISLLSALQEGSLPSLKKKIDSAPVLSEADIKIALPIASPPKIICVGLNYADHKAEGPYKDKKFTYPTFFGRYNTSLVAHGQPIIRPLCSPELDWEGELVAIIGRKGKHIDEAKAIDYVAGYSLCNEATIRDYQFKTTQWTVGKNFDATAAFGPEFVTPDELPRSVKEGLKIETRLNGEVVQSATTADLIFDIPQLISILSEAITLEPGDLLVTGTPGGVGFVRKPKWFMKDGDIAEVEVEGVGVLKSPIKDEAPWRS